MNPFKVWWIPQVPMKKFEVRVRSVEEGAKILQVLAAYDAFQFENHIKPDYCNAGGLMVLEDLGGDGPEWCDWCDYETGEDDPIAFVRSKKNNEYNDRSDEPDETKEEALNG